MAKIIHQYGEQIGECIYLEDIPSSEAGKDPKRRYAKFQCECGAEFISQIESVKRRKTKSCGCLNTKTRVLSGKKKKTHGMTGTPEYYCWQGMKDRCYNKSSPSYDNYGARGITVCDRWINSFENFYNDIGKYYVEGLELDRIDVNGNYFPENCKWSTEQEQSWNQRVYKNNSTGCAGVTRASRNKNKFEVRISKDNIEHQIGTFNTLEDAVEARKQAEIEYYGEVLESKRIRSINDL